MTRLRRMQLVARFMRSATSYYGCQHGRAHIREVSIGKTQWRAGRWEVTLPGLLAILYGSADGSRRAHGPRGRIDG